jgi:hypothetical protein
MLDIIILILGGFLALMAILFFINPLTNKKLLMGKEGIIFDVSKYLLILLLILISINKESIIGVIIFSIAGLGVWYLGNKMKK